MNARRAVAVSLAIIAVALVIGVAALFVYYRPSVQYVYVDLLDRRPSGGSNLRWAVTGVVLGVLGLGIWRSRRSHV